MIVINCEQGTPEWFALKVGVPGASSFAKIVTSKGEASKQRLKYLYQLAGERLIGAKEEGFSNGSMQRGVELEPEARELYELITGNTVDQVGFCFMDEAKRFGCSPDGLIGEEGGLEIKCPSLPVHVEYLLNGKIPTDYIQQVQGSLYITGREWWDFMSYYPGCKPLIVRVTPDARFHVRLADELELFCDELEEVSARLAAV